MSKRIVVDSASLRQAVRRAATFVPAKPVLPVCEMFNFVINPDAAWIEAFDGESIIQVRFTVREPVSAPHCFQLNAKAVKALISSIGMSGVSPMADEAEIIITVNTKTIVFSSGRIRHSLPVPDGDAFMKVPECVVEQSVILNGSAIHNCERTINKLISDAEHDKTNAFGTGLTIQYDEGSLYIWGGNRSRVGGMRVKYYQPLPSDFSLLVNEKLITKGSVLYSGDDSVVIGISQNHLEVKTNDLRIVSARLVAKPPSFLRLFKTTNSSPQLFILELALFEIRSSCERLSVHTDAIMRELLIETVKDTRQVTLSVNNKAASSNGDEQIHIYSAEVLSDATICVDIIFIQDVLRQCSANNIKIQSTDKTMLICNTTEDHDFFYIIALNSNN